MSIKFYATIKEHENEGYVYKNVQIELDEESLSQLAVAIFNARVEGVFGRAKSLFEKLRDLDFQSLF